MGNGNKAPDITSTQLTLGQLMGQLSVKQALSVFAAMVTIVSTVFYFGHTIGSSKSSVSDAQVAASDKQISELNVTIKRHEAKDAVLRKWYRLQIAELRADQEQTKEARKQLAETIEFWQSNQAGGVDVDLIKVTRGVEEEATIIFLCDGTKIDVPNFYVGTQYKGA